MNTFCVLMLPAQYGMTLSYGVTKVNNILKNGIKGQVHVHSYVTVHFFECSLICILRGVHSILAFSKKS